MTISSNDPSRTSPSPGPAYTLQRIYESEENQLLPCVDSNNTRELQRSLNILRAGNDPKLCKKHLNEALFSAAKNGRSTCAKTLLESDADVNMLNQRKESVLHVATGAYLQDPTIDRYDTVRVLLDGKAEAGSTARASDGTFPYQLAFDDKSTQGKILRELMEDLGFGGTEQDCLDIANLVSHQVQRDRDEMFQGVAPLVAALTTALFVYGIASTICAPNDEDTEACVKASAQTTLKVFKQTFPH